MAGNAELQVVAIAGLSGIHAFAPRLRFLSVVPRSVWLSAAGGISVAYVFVHLLPELAEGQRQISEEVGAGLRRVENHVYLIALAGLALFYAVEWSSRRSRERRRGDGGPDATGPSALWLSLGSFALYNALIGYVVVHRERETTWSLVTFAVAIGVHFLVTDAGLIRHHGRAFDDHVRLGRRRAAGAPGPRGLAPPRQEAPAAVTVQAPPAPPRTLLVDEEPHRPADRHPTAWWGMLLLVVTEAALFAVLIASYFYLRFRVPTAWPPDGIEAPKLLLPIVMTVLLASSSIPMWLAERGARAGRSPRRVTGLLCASMVLGIGFLVLQGVEYSDALDQFRPSTDAYGSLFYTITGLHGSHVAAGLVLTGWTAVRAARGVFADRRRCGVATTALYWHFVHAVWLVVFCSLYLSPHA